MSAGKGKCQRGKTKKPSKCSSARIKKCHGDDKKHPCASGKRKKK